MQAQAGAQTQSGCDAPAIREVRVRHGVCVFPIGIGATPALRDALRGPQPLCGVLPRAPKAVQQPIAGRIS